MRRVTIHIPFLAAYLALGTMLQSQPAALSFQQLSIAEGLSNSTVYAIHQDARGFMWFGTAEGLNRYDGYSFRVFSPQADNPSSISGDMVTSIAEDAEGKLWLGVWYGGLNCYNPRTGSFKTFLPNPDQPANSEANSVWAVAIDAQGYIWAGTHSSGLYRFNPKTGQFRAFRHDPANPATLSSNAISALLPDGDRLWIATADGGLNRLDRRSEKIVPYRHDSASRHSLISNQLNTLLLDRSGNLWIGTKDQGVVMLDSSGTTFSRIPALHMPGNPGSSNIRSFLQDHTGAIWAGTDGGGIVLFYPNGQSSTRLTHHPAHPDGLRSNVIFHLYQSRDSIIWIGAYKAGVQVFNEKRIKFPQHDPHLRIDRLSYKTVFSILEDSKHRLWLGTDGGGLNVYDPETHQFRYYRHRPGDPGSLSGDAIKAIYEDRYGYLWVGTYGRGLNALPPGQDQWLRFAFDAADEGSLSGEHVWDICEDSEGNLWVATLGKGLNRLDRRTMRFHRFNKTNTGNGLPSDQVYTLLRDDARKRLWIGTDKGLGYVDLRKGAFKPAFSDSILMSYEVKTMHLDHKGRIWFGAKKNGLYSFDPSTGALLSFRKEQGMLSNTVTAILEDQQQHLWISSTRGISRLDPASGTFYHYHTGDGLHNTEYVTESAFALRDGRLIFGGPEGFDLIDGRKRSRSLSAPKVVLTRLWIMNKEVLPGKHPSTLQEDISRVSAIRLKRTEKLLSVEVSALNYTNPDKSRYAYLLEGYDSDWHFIEHRRTITWTNLPAGTYTLHVKASNDEGIWSPEPARLVIHVEGAWLQSAWLGLLLPLFGLAYALFMIQKRRRGQLERDSAIPAPIDSLRPSIAKHALPGQQEFLEKALGIVETHISDADFSVTQFSRLMGMSRSSLHQKLKECTGQSASDFIRTQRLKQAADLLKQQRYTVSEIAYRCGFNDPKYFHRCFKELYGVTPGSFAGGLQV